MMLYGPKNWYGVIVWAELNDALEFETNIPQRIRLPYYLATSHLSKWPSDLKINGTKDSGPVFHGLSCGVLLFVASVSFKTPL